MPDTTRLTSRIAGLQADDTPTVVSGVAVGPGDVTRGLEGARKVWLAEHLEPAAASLEGVPLTKDHSPTVDDTIGEVVAAGYVAGEGVVFEAEIDDPEVAEKIENGRLEVSIEASHADGGEHDETGAMVPTGIEFTTLSVVQRGAAPSNDVDGGPAQALAAMLSPAEIHAALAETATQPDDPETGEVTSGPAPDTNQATKTDMTETDSEATDDGPTTEELQAKLGKVREDLAAIRDERDALQDENEQLQDEYTQLQDEKVKLQEEIDAVAEAYATALATEDSPFTAADYADRFDVAELREKFEAREDASLIDPGPEPEPDVQSGDPGDDSNDDETEAELARLQEKREVFANTALMPRLDDEIAALEED